MELLEMELPGSLVFLAAPEMRWERSRLLALPPER
jgi:hypothetical protein